MKIKRFINSVLACAMVCTAVPYVSYSVTENVSLNANAVDEDEYTEGTYENFIYKAYADHVEISYYNNLKKDKVEQLIFPSEINGLPVTSIGNGAIWGLPKLESAILPEGITKIGENAFKQCGNLKSVILPNSLTIIDEFAFSICKNLTEITIPANVTNIGMYAFCECSSLTEINIPNGVTSIEDSVFANCSSLTKINIPDSVTSIGSNAFENCSSLTEITIPNSVTKIGNSVFANSGLTSITIPESVTYINYRAFKNCSNLTEITIPNSVTKIGNSVFANSGLTSITIPESVTYIDYSAFEDCLNLNEITIKNPKCELHVSTNIPQTATIYGYINSTAQKYAKNKEITFKSLGYAPFKGDTTGDILVDIADIVAISAYVGDSKINLLDEQLIKNGDVHNTGDGLTANDALMIQQYLSGNITTLE